MMREPKPWWAKRTGSVNVAIVAVVTMFILWATLLR